MSDGGAFGATLRALRGMHALSQFQLAERLGSTQRHVSFLESGRSAPTREMLQRLARDLALPPAQQEALFTAAGFQPPHGPEDDAAVAVALDMLDRQLLAHWPFPGFVLNPCFDMLRANEPGRAMLAPFHDGNALPNILLILCSPAFRARVRNWDEIAPGLVLRLHAQARRYPEFAARLDGLDLPLPVKAPQTAPAALLIPVEIAQPDGAILRLTSVIGRLGTVHEGAISRLEVELLVPAGPADAAQLTPGRGNG